LTTGKQLFIISRMRSRLRQLWVNEEGQDVAEYAVMLAVILLLVVGTIKLIGTGNRIPNR
jgi:Flp pilus assembly pilin Flp